MQFSEKLSKFTRETPWTFAKTYAETWPHEYPYRNYLYDTEILSKRLNDISYEYRKEFVILQ